jgi:branched-chain amino acid aminotransferase
MMDGIGFLCFKILFAHHTLEMRFVVKAYRVTPGESLLIPTQAITFDELTDQLPQGFYTTFRTYDARKRVLGLDAHLQRLYRPLAANQIHPAVSPFELRRSLAIVLQDLIDEARVRLVMTISGVVYIVLMPLMPLPPEIYRKGVKVITADVERKSPREKLTTFISESKNTRTQIANSHVFEALLVRNNYILEGMTSNFFYFKEGSVGTAQKDILLGVTRRAVLRVARGSGICITYRPLKREQVPALDEAFLTSSSRGIVPIVRIDATQVGEGSPGPIAKKLSNAYNAYVLSHAEIIQP